jgi:hypothetical protein
LGPYRRLWEILKRRKGIKVYALPNFGLEFKDKAKNLEGRLLENENFSEISKDILVTGLFSFWQFSFKE